MMMSRLNSLIAAAMIPIAIAYAVDADGQSPRREEVSLITIVKKLEMAGYGPFTELSIDDGNWEIEVRKQNESVELLVDPVNGEILSEHRDDSETAPPASAMPLSKLLQSLADNAGYKEFDDVSFERRYWEIEAFKDGQKMELLVDPRTARIVSERFDD